MWVGKKIVCKCTWCGSRFSGSESRRADLRKINLAFIQKRSWTNHLTNAMPRLWNNQCRSESKKYICRIEKDASSSNQRLWSGAVVVVEWSTSLPTVLTIPVRILLATEFVQKINWVFKKRSRLVHLKTGCGHFCYRHILIFEMVCG